MAEQQEMNKPNGVIARVTHAITKDGMLAAAFRQGRRSGGGPAGVSGNHPCGDTGHVPEPTQGEIAADRKLPTPSEIARTANSPTGRSRITLRSMDMADDKAAFRRVDWRCVDMRGGNMTGLNLRNADMRAGNFAGCNFSGSDLSYADFRGANVQGAIFQNATLYGAKMQGAAAHRADFRGADLRQCNFGGAYLEGAVMPPPERRPTPSEIAKDKGTREPDRSRRTRGRRAGSVAGAASHHSEQDPSPDSQEELWPLTHRRGRYTTITRFRMP